MSPELQQPPRPNYAEEEDKASTDMEYKMYWMQDADPSADEEIVATVNQYVAVAGDASAVTSTSLSAASAAYAMNAAAANSAATVNKNASVVDNSQADAPISISENLGMPQAGSGSV